MKLKSMKQDLSYLCPFCDREVKVGSSCQGCANKQKAKAVEPGKTAKPKRAWEQDKMYEDLDLPDEDFDYDEFVAKEFGRMPHKKIGVKWYWWVLGVFLLVVMMVSLANVCLQ